MTMNGDLPDMEQVVGNTRKSTERSDEGLRQRISSLLQAIAYSVKYLNSQTMRLIVAKKPEHFTSQAIVEESRALNAV
jgi:hypothetical protein